MSVIHDDSREDQREASIARDRAEGSVGLPVSDQIVSVDTLRGLKVLLMVFVNDLGSVAPSSRATCHAPG
jgi:hypothetical protein